MMLSVENFVNTANTFAETTEMVAKLLSNLYYCLHHIIPLRGIATQSQSYPIFAIHSPGIILSKTIQHR